MAAAALLLAGHAVHAEVRQPFVPLDPSLVLSQSSVEAIAQDRDGYLWIGTQGGLDRYDGYRIDSWHTDPDDHRTLSHNFVVDLLVARDNSVWVGTQNGLDRLDPATRSVTRFAIQTPGGRRIRGPIARGTLVEDANGDIYALAASDRLRPVRWRAGRQALNVIPVDDPADPDPSGRLTADSLVIDRAGRIWMANPTGLWRLDRDRDRFVRVLSHQPPVPARWMGNRIAAAGPGNGILYASTDGLYRVDPDAGEPIRLLRPTDNGLDSDWVRAVASDESGAIWFTQPGVVARIDPIDGSWQTFEMPRLDRRSMANSGYFILGLEETRDGSIWLAGLFGLARYDPQTRRLNSYLHDPNDPASPPPTLGEIGYRIFVDRFDVLWVGGSLGGLAQRAPQSERFIHVSDRTPTPTSRNIVRAITEQRVGDDTFVWTSVQNKGLVVWQQTGARSYQRVADYPAFGAAGELGVVRDFIVDPKTGEVWIIGNTGIGRARRPGEPLDRMDTGGFETIVGTRVGALLDARTLLVMGGIRNGPEIWRIDLDTLAVTPIDAEPNSRTERGSFVVFDLLVEPNGTLAAATTEGLALIDGDGATRWHLPSPPGSARPENQLFSIAADGRGGYWLGTRGGGLLHAEFIAEDQPVFRRYTTENGLPDDTVYAVLRTDDDTLWLSTNRGVARFDPAAGSFRQFTPSDGLQGWEFNHAVAHRGESGRFYFGGINGWNAFEPERIQQLPGPPILNLDAVRVNGRIQPPDAGGRLPALRHDRNRLQIDYVGLQLAAPERIRYAYRLIGVDEDWVEAGATRSARYPDLAPGSYRFELRARNLDGVWSGAETLLSFEIRRPPWATVWAYIAYALAVALLVAGGLVRQRRIRRRLEAEVERRTEEVNRQNELIGRQARDLESALAARTTLFANISHEFRTPLTLIEAAVDRLERETDPKAAFTARRYLARLLRLVEQLLDLSRLGTTRESAADTHWRLDSVVEQTVEAFRSVAERRGIEIRCHCDTPWRTRCSQELVEKILLNLLGNAVKFTPEGGSVDVSLDAGTRGAELIVADTGPGIAAVDQARIFERFYRADGDSRDRQAGAGIGLALVFEAVRALGGDVRVDSRPGYGARFIVALPAEPRDSSDRPRPLDPERQRMHLEILEPADKSGVDMHTAAPQTDAKAGTILVVEDNADLRRYIGDCLSPDWRVVEAEDGVAGFAMALEHDCDVIVSDLMMPRADGFEMLEKLRGDVRTSHIPVLFLTARQDHETRLRAFALSADAFLAKPFRRKELLARLKQIADSRIRLREHIHHSHGLAPTLEPSKASSGKPPAATGERKERPRLSPRDREFLAALDQWLREHHGNPSITIGDLADAMHLTPRTLQRKLRSLVDRTPAAYLREYRMARARERLRNTEQPVTDIAFSVGYSSSQYFSRAFRELHGEPPETWRQHQSGDADHALRYP